MLKNTALISGMDVRYADQVREHLDPAGVSTDLCRAHDAETVQDSTFSTFG